MVRRLIASGLLLMMLVGGCGGAGPAPPRGDAKAGAPRLGSPTTGALPVNPSGTTPTPREPAAPPPASTLAPCTVPAPAAQTRHITVLVYFSCEADPDRPHAVTRLVPATGAVLAAALTELLRGPTDAEKAAGLRSWFSSETAGMLREVRIQDGTAHVDFKNFQSIIPNASTSAGSAQLLGEVGRTIFQFPAVKQADVRFDGSCQAFWGWLQRDCDLLRADRYRQQK